MNSVSFNKQDIEQIHAIGLTERSVRDQIEIFKKGTPYLTLVRPCTVDDGIRRFNPELFEKNIAIFDKHAADRRLIKFVPASGAATRMVKTLIKANKAQSIHLSDVDAGLLTDKKENQELSEFIAHIRRFAFYPDLKSSMAVCGLDPDSAIAKGDFKDLINFLITEKGLNYANLPKGLIKFHAYPEQSRSAFEEHLVEAVGYGAGKNRLCALHFTVSESHKQKFQTLFQQVKNHYETRYNVTFHVSFSIQKNDTNTVAVDMDNRPFRGKDGRLLFRPGGHGALIDNLNRLKGDIIFIKNIDNVAHDRFKAEMIFWKKALAGYLLDLQQQVFSYLNRLNNGPITPPLIEAAAEFVQKELGQSLPADFHAGDGNQQKKELIQVLNRPLRVCGMVPNAGEPGGGPFWVRGNDRRNSLQIVETSQINVGNKDQKHILESLTHFNPVDIVCGVRDWKGEPFDLSRFVDPDAVFVTQKSESGRNLKALEHPGLWNGAMAFWNTVFVEVPLITFNPVKQITDLLRKAHLP